MCAQARNGVFAVAGVAALCVFHACVIRCGAPAYGGVLTAAAALVLIWLPGCFLRDILSGTQEELRLTQSLVCGLALFAAVSVAASWSGVHALIYLPAVLGAWQAVRRRGMGVPWKKWTAPLGIWLAVLLVYGICAADYAHATALGVVTPNQDFYYNVANVDSLMQGFPPAQLRFAGMTLRYHFLTELTAAGLCMATGLGAFDMLGFFVTPLLLLAMLCVIWECGCFLFRDGKKASGWQIAFLLLFSCAGLYKVLDRGLSPFWNLMIRHLITNINGMVLATLLMAAVLGLYEWCMRNPRSQSAFVYLVLGVLLLTFSKAPIAGVAVIALVCASAVESIRGRTFRPFLKAAVVAAVFAAIYFGYFSKNAQGAVELSLTGTLYKSYFSNILQLIKIQTPSLWPAAVAAALLAQTFLFSPAVVLLYASGLVRDVRRMASLPAWRLFANAMAVGGMAAFFLFDHEAMSQMYFAFAGVFFMGALAAENLTDFLAWARGKRNLPIRAAKAVLAFWMAVSVATGLCQYAYLIKTNLPVLINPEAAVQRFPSKTPVTAAEEQALLWLRDHCGEDEVFLTNRIHSGSALESFSFIHTGISGRSCYLETSKLAASNTGADGDEILHRLQVIGTVYGGADAQDWQQLCREEGIRWVVYLSYAAGDWICPQGAEPVFENECVTIFFVEPSA